VAVDQKFQFRQTVEDHRFLQTVDYNLRVVDQIPHSVAADNYLRLAKG
jgi:hypothetical protein